LALYIFAIDKFISLIYYSYVETRAHILKVASDLLAKHGAEGLTTRAVCEAAGVTSPTLYHHFRDKDGLLAAVVSDAFERFLAAKRSSTAHSSGDPVEDLKQGWDNSVNFADQHPKVYAAMLVAAANHPEAIRQAYLLLLQALAPVARAGRLRVEMELAAQTLWSAVHGLNALRVTNPDNEWKGELSDTLRDAIIAAVTKTAKEAGKPMAEDRIRLVLRANGIQLPKGTS
jgi:AcrR family transcriptional regulator